MKRWPRFLPSIARKKRMDEKEAGAGGGRDGECACRARSYGSPKRGALRGSASLIKEMHLPKKIIKERHLPKKSARRMAGAMRWHV